MQFIDVLRTQYVAFPRWLRQGIGPMVRLAPASLRYGASFGRLKNDICRSRRDAAFVLDMQTEMVRRVLSDAYRSSTHFRQLIDERLGPGFDPLRAVPSDIFHLPVLSRETLLDKCDDLLVAPLSTVDLKQTSGSTSSQPARIYLDRDRSVRETAFVHSVWGQAGFRTGERQLILRDGLTYQFNEAEPWDYDPGLNELRLSPYHMVPSIMDRYLERISAWKPRVIYGLPSALTILGRHAVHAGWKPPGGLRGIFTSSETLFPSQREIIAETFGCPHVSSYYGLTERNAFAGEVPGQPDVFEFEPLYGLTELVDADGNPVTRPGEVGRIVSTGFLSRAMALIRYDTGDRARLVRAASAENCWRLQVSGIRSKWSQEFVIARKGNPLSVLNLVFQSHAGLIRDFQFYQDTPGKIIFKIVPYANVEPSDIDPLLGEMRGMFGEILDIDIEFVSDLVAGPNGKRRLVDQRLPLPDACIVDYSLPLPRALEDIAQSGLATAD